MVQLRNNENRKRAGKQLRVVMKHASKMRKLGHIIEPIKPKERGYTGKGLFYGIRVKTSIDTRKTRSGSRIT